MRKPYFSKTRQCWFLRTDSSQINLGKDKTEAFKKFAALLAGQETARPGETAVKIINDFLEWSKVHQAVATYENYRWSLEKFSDHLGKSLKVTDLKPFHVLRWIDKQGWTGNTANGAIRAAVRPFSWAAKLGVIPHNPLARVERPSPTPRECYLTPEQLDTVTAKIKDEEFRDLVMFLRETGCRPQELRIMEARHFNRVGKVITFPRIESKGKKRQRTIVLNVSALAIIQRLAMKHPDGPLFRNVDGNQWKPMAIINRFRRLRLATGIDVSAYCCRHSFITDALLNGVEPLTVATLAGHTSIKMIWSVYQHLQLQTGHMRAAAEQAVIRRVS